MAGTKTSARRAAARKPVAKSRAKPARTAAKRPAASLAKRPTQSPHTGAQIVERSLVGGIAP